VFALPLGSTMWQNVAGGYSRLVGISPLFPNAGTWRGNVSTPTTGLTLHPISSVTVTLVATGLGATINVTPLIPVGGTDYSPGATSVNPAAGPVTISWTWNANPNTSVAWTPSDIYGFNTGSNTVGFTTGTAVSFVDVVVNQITLTVQYQAGFSNYFTQTDQFDIVKNLVDDAQSTVKFGAGYDLGIHTKFNTNGVDDVKSGVLLDRLEAYRPWLAKNLGDAIRELAGLQNGFDYQMQYVLNPLTNRVDKTLKLYYPTKGRETGFIFEYDRSPGLTNVIERGFGDAVNFAWAGDGWGATPSGGNEAARLRAPFIDQTQRGQYPPYDAAPSWSTVSEQTTLNQLTEAMFLRTKLPNRVPVIRVDPDAYPQWGDYDLGDIVCVTIDDGYGSTPPTGQRNRITGWQVTSAPVYDLVLADPLPDLGQILPPAVP